MNEVDRLPSKEKVKKLQKSNRNVYAIRCALRVQPLIIFPESEEYNTAELKRAVLQLDSQLESLVNSDKVDLRVIDNAINRIVSASVNAASASANAANACKAAAHSQSNIAFKNSVDLTLDAAIYAAKSATITTGINTAVNLVRATKSDYEKLKASKIKVTDASETGPLGDLWHGSPPDWYIEAKTKYDKTITEWKREIAESDSINNEERILSVYIDPGTSSPELITELYVALDALYRANGGSGLQIVKEDRRSMVGESVQ
ncbi:hypothetical protein FYZ48_28685 [Gimesia chilikensis]|uniref:hypothetical protein n=1 Tax=Gimesia chilikensis TaxID=2605989 RepID=UPI0011EDF59B|nr:hypothetical protein [Gimesia chilikensis]KAA0132093.1 hypothetical protein FYZ48_28685 [Gimesia chilikensis]